MKKDSRIVRGEKTVHFFSLEACRFPQPPGALDSFAFSAAAFHTKVAVTLLFSIHCFNPLTSFQYSAKISEVRRLPFLCIFSWRTGHTRSGIGKNGAGRPPVPEIWEDPSMSINFESHKLDRRSFLKGAGMVGAASLLAACGGKSDNGSSAASTSGAAPPTPPVPPR